MDQHSGRPDQEPAAPAAYGSGARSRHPDQPPRPADADRDPAAAGAAGASGSDGTAVAGSAAGSAGSGGSAGSAWAGSGANGAFGGSPVSGAGFGAAGAAGVHGSSGVPGVPGAGGRPPLPVRPVRGRKAAGAAEASGGSPDPAASDAGATPPRMRIPYGTTAPAPAAPGAGIPRIPPSGSIARASAFPPGAGRPDAAATGGGELELAPRRPLDLRGRRADAADGSAAGKGTEADAGAQTGTDDGGVPTGPRALGSGGGLPELPGGTATPAQPGAVRELPGGTGPDAGTQDAPGGPYGAAAGHRPDSGGFDAFGTGRPLTSGAGTPRPQLPASVERALTSQPFDAFGTGRSGRGSRTAADRRPFPAALGGMRRDTAADAGTRPGSLPGQDASGAVEAEPAHGFAPAPAHEFAPDAGGRTPDDAGTAAVPDAGQDTPDQHAADLPGGPADHGSPNPSADRLAPFDGAPGAAPVREPRAGAGSFDGFAAGSPGARRHTPHPLPVRGAAPEDAGESPVEQSAPPPRSARPARDPLGAPEIGVSGGSGSRVRRVVTTDFLVTVNPVDGSEVVPCPPGEARVPARRSAEERAARMNAARPTPPPGPPAPELPLLEREEERERLIRLLSHGRTVRVTGPSGSGRTALLDAVAAGCADLAPEGVLRLSGYRRTSADLMHDLYALVYGGEDYRPSPAELTRLLADVGAVVVVDDLEFGGGELESLLATVPECALLLAAAPDAPAPAAESAVEDVALSGLSRAACMDLLVLAAGRPLAEDETAWAADLWFESEGLPLRFVQAGALLRQRDAMRPPAVPEPADWEDSVWQNGAVPPPAPQMPDLPDLSAFDVFEDAPGAGDAAAGSGGVGGDDGFAGFDGASGRTPGAGPSGGAGRSGAGDGMPSIPLGEAALPGASGAPGASQRPAAGEAAPLPSLAQSAAPAELLASRLGESAREALAFAVALDGECPHPSHLPALVGDTHGDAALGELTAAGLAVPVAGHFRLAAGVAHQLAPVLRADGELSEVQAHTAALHYTWWTGHRSVTPERAATESEAILAALAACAREGNAGAAVLLARTVAPVFAAALAWGAWERTLRIGQDAARQTGEVTEEAYFLHELGVLELCTGRYAAARVELEASLALRGVLADRQGLLVGRRTLALVADREAAAGGSPLPALTAYSRPAAEAEDVTTRLPAVLLDTTMPVVISKAHPAAAGPAGSARSGRGAPSGLRRLAVAGRRRTAVVAGAGVLLVAALGTLVALGTGNATSDTPDDPGQPVESAQPDTPATTDAAEPPATTTTAPTTTASPSTSAAATTTPPATTRPATRAATPNTPTSPRNTPTGGLTSSPTSPPAGGGHGHTPKPTTPTTTKASPTNPSPTTTAATPTPTLTSGGTPGTPGGTTGSTGTSVESATTTTGPTAG